MRTPKQKQRDEQKAQEGAQLPCWEQWGFGEGDGCNMHLRH